MVLPHQPRQRLQRRRPLPVRGVRIDRRRSRRPCRWRRPPRPWCRSAGRGRDPWWAACRLGPRAAGRAGCRRRRAPPRPRRPAGVSPSGRGRGGRRSGCARPSGRRPAATGRRPAPGPATPTRAATISSEALRAAGSAAASSGSSIARPSTPSFSPRNIARMRWEGSLVSGSAWLEPVGELRARLLLALDDRRHQAAAPPQPLAQLSDDVRRPRRTARRGWPARPPARRRRRAPPRRRRRTPAASACGSRVRVPEQAERERLQARLAGDLRPGPPLGLVRQVDVLEARLGVGGRGSAPRAPG